MIQKSITSCRYANTAPVRIFAPGAMRFNSIRTRIRFDSIRTVANFTHVISRCVFSDKLIDINDFRTMYLESHNKLKTNLKECLKYGPNDGQQQQQQHQNNNVQSLEVNVHRQHQIEVEAKMVKSERIEAEDPYNNIIIDETQLIHHQNQTSSNKENNIVDMAMSMASMNTMPEPQKNGVPKKAVARGKSRKKAKAAAAAQHQMMATDDQRYDNDTNLLDISNGNANATAQELQYIILQSDTKIFSCNNCEQQFISEDFLKQHMQKAHPVLSELVQTPTLSPMTIHPQSQLIYLCHLCESKQFTSEIQLSHHMFIHSEIAAGTLSENPFPICSCDHCLPLTHEKMSIGEYETDQTQTEMVMEHQQQTQQMQTEQVITNQPTKVIKHTEADGTVTTLYSCSVCNKSTFKTNARLLKHMRIHSNQQPFACEICQKVYNASSSLRTHQRMVHNMVAKSSTENGGGNAAVVAATTNATNNVASSVSSSASSAAASAKNDNAVAKLATHVKEHMDANDVMLTTKAEDIETDDITEEVVMEQ